MAILKVIEVLANSEKGWEDATANALKEASKTVKNIKSIYIQEMSTTVKDGEIDQYRINAKITFVVNN